jgi:hypothetical protein
VQARLIIDQINDTSFAVSGSHQFNVSFLSGTIALYGAVGMQFFKNLANVPPDQIGRVFLSETEILAAAELHKETTTDRDMFLASLDDLLQAKIIDQKNKNVLREFILKCDCPPLVIWQKLRMLGYDHLKPHLKFERPKDELLSTVEAMRIFVDGIRNTPAVKSKEAQNLRAGRSRAAVQSNPLRGADGRSNSSD